MADDLMKTGDTPLGWTCPVDPRFQNANQTKWCFQMFYDYHKCQRLMGNGYTPCDFFRRCYQSICPNSWIERWNEQLENGTYPKDLPEPRDNKKK